MPQFRCEVSPPPTARDVVDRPQSEPEAEPSQGRRDSTDGPNPRTTGMVEHQPRIPRPRRTDSAGGQSRNAHYRVSFAESVTDEVETFVGWPTYPPSRCF